MSSEMNLRDGNGSPLTGKHSTVLLDGSELQAMRHRLHELANVFTGVMIAGGLLSQHLEGGLLRQYASDVCEGSARGCLVVCELRSQLLAALGEAEVAKGSGALEAAPGEQGIL